MTVKRRLGVSPLSNVPTTVASILPSFHPLVLENSDTEKQYLEDPDVGVEKAVAILDCFKHNSLQAYHEKLAEHSTNLTNAQPGPFDNEQSTKLDADPQ